MRARNLLPPLFLILLPLICAGSPDGIYEFSVTTAPFEIEQKYKSMEGPMVVVPVTVDQLFREKDLVLEVSANDENRLVWIRERRSKKEKNHEDLWWFTGARIQAIGAETDETISDEFICHLNIDVDRERRSELFPESPGGSSRLLTLTGWATEFRFPDEFGVPVAGSEPLTIYFQALNHNRDGKQTFRHRLSLFFKKDSDFAEEIQPLTFHWPSIAVPVKEDEKPSRISVGSCSCCAPATAAANAPANPETGLFTGPGERTFSGHWILPTGRSEWNFPVNYYSPGFAGEDTMIHAMIPHLHPFAEKLELLAHRHECEEQETIATMAVTNRDQGIGISEIETFSSATGIPVSSGDDFELRAVYNNTSDEQQDSMATLGIFSRDLQWKRPVWADATFGGTPPTCGIPPP